MKTRAVFFILLFLLKAYSGKAPAEASILNRIQQKIDADFVNGLLNKNTNALTEWEEKLARMKENPLAQYWHIYALFYEAVCHGELGDKRASYAKVKQGIKAMKHVKN